MKTSVGVALMAYAIVGIFSLTHHVKSRALFKIYFNNIIQNEYQHRY